MSVTLKQIADEFQQDLDLFGEPQPVKKTTQPKSHNICLPCAESLFDYIPNDEVKFKSGTCSICNEDTQISDARNFGIKLK